MVFCGGGRDGCCGDRANAGPGLNKEMDAAEDFVGRSGSAGQLQQRRICRRAVRAACEVRHATVPERSGVRGAREAEMLTNWRPCMRPASGSTKGFCANQRGVDAAAVQPQWLEWAPRPSRQSSLVVDPPDGHVPAFTPEAKALQAAMAATRGKRPESWLDLTMYDRYTTRGVAGSIFPRDLWQRDPDRAGARSGRHPQRDDSRDAHHSAGWASVMRRFYEMSA